MKFFYKKKEKTIPFAFPHLSYTLHIRKIFYFQYFPLMPVYSFSQLQLFEQCPRKYQYRYLDKIETPFEITADLVLWQAVHKSLERLYQWINTFRTPSVEECLQRFHDARQAESEKNEIIIKGDKTIDDYKRRGEHYINEYYQQHQPFTDHQIVATEMRLSFALDEDKKFRGVVDRIDKKETTFIINDYKTNQHLPDADKLDYREQLTLYAVGIKHKYGKYCDRIVAKLHYVHFGLCDEREVTDALMDEVTQKYIGHISAIEQARFHLNMGDSNAFQPTENAYCKYCPYQSICPLRAHMNMDDDAISSELSESTIKKLVDRYITTQQQLVYDKKQQETIKELLTKYMEEKQLTRLFSEQWQVSVSFLRNISITDKEILREKLAQLWQLDNALELDRHKLKKLLDEGAIDIKKLGWSVSERETMTLRVKSVS